MKNILIAIRSIFKKGRHNVMKIVSLGIGLAVGLVLIAKVYFEQSYDDFYPDRDRVYQVWAKYQQNGGELKDYPQTSGGIAPTMQQQIPEIETVTRYTSFGDWTFTMTDTKMKYSGRCIIADSCFFDILPRPMLIGNAKEVLSIPMYVLVSSRIAKNIGGDVIGKNFTVDSSPGRTMTIGGVFEEVPENSHSRYDVIVSMASAGRFMWEGSPTNMLGNDRYISYVKLHKGVNPLALEEQVHTFVNSYFPPEEQQKTGFNIGFSFHELDGLHKELPQVKRMTWILSLLAFALIFTAVMNYILIVISSIVNRSKEVAVHKCYGASENNIHGMMFGEALVHIVLSLILALLLILAFRGTVEELLATSLDSLLLSNGSLVLLGICILVFFVSGFMPGSLYARIPVASAFRNYRENKRIWKKALLLVQFVATGFLVTMLVFVARQYTFMVNDRPGYAYENLAYCGLAGVDSTSRAKILDEVMRLPGVVEGEYALGENPYVGAGALGAGERHLHSARGVGAQRGAGRGAREKPVEQAYFPRVRHVKTICPAPRRRFPNSALTTLCRRFPFRRIPKSAQAAARTPWRRRARSAICADAAGRIFRRVRRAFPATRRRGRSRIVLPRRFPETGRARGRRCRATAPIRACALRARSPAPCRARAGRRAGGSPPPRRCAP
mgnify:CR=1 FL=1